MNWVEIPFNTWNMAEFAIGFFGGIGLAYDIFSSKWPENSNAPKRWENISAMLVVLVIIPVIIFRESFSYRMFMEKYQQLPNTETIVFSYTTTAAILITLLIIVSWYILAKSNFQLTKKIVLQLFIMYSVCYYVLSYIATGLFMGTFLSNSNHHLYLVNIAAIALLIGKERDIFSKIPSQKIDTNRWLILIFILFISVAAMAWLSIGLHDETGPLYDRFPMG